MQRARIKTNVSHSGTKTLIEIRKKKHVLLEGEASD